MATNQDFNNLITRIDAATDTLELNVGVIAETGVEVGEQLTLAQTAAANAAQEANNATVQANISSVKATVSTTQATKAEQQAQVATQAKTDAIAAVDEAKALAPFQEAPKNGSVYGRKDGTWALVEGGGSGGVGTVVSVNGVLPDLQGDVTLTIPEQVPSDWNATSGKGVILNKPKIFSGAYVDLVGKPTLFSGSYNDLTNKPTLFNGSYNSLTNKPTIPTNNNQLVNGANYITDAPNDGKQYARKSLTWVEVEAGESGTNLGYPVLEVPYYNDVTMTNWLRPNPYEPLQLSKFADYVDGEFLRGAELVSGGGLGSLPSGNYYFGSGDFLGQPVTVNVTGSTGATALGSKNGILEVRTTIPLPTAGKKILTAYVLSDDFEIIETWHLNTTTFEWVQEGVAEQLPPTPQEPATSVVNKRTTTPFETWIGTQSQYDAVGSKDPNTLYWITEV